MSNAFTHSISTSLPERHAAASSDPSLRTPEPHSGHRLSASLRRAKTATGNSLRKLFKGHSSSAKRSGNDAAPGAAPFLPLSSEEAQHRSPGSPLDHQHQHHTISSTPMFAKSPVLLRRYHTERRPSSSHSTKSARTIFSAAKRFRIRSSSMSYRRGSEEMDDGGLFSLDQPPLAHASASVNRGSAVPWPITIPEDSDVPTIPDQEEPSSPGCSLPVSSGQRLRHAGSIKCLKERRNASTELLARSRKPSVNTTTDTTPTRQPSRYRRHPLPPARPLPLAPSTPPHSSMATEDAKSPTSYSSRSLGLNSLDFAYDEHSATNLLPPSPIDSSLARRSPASSMSATSSQLQPLTEINANALAASPLLTAASQVPFHGTTAEPPEELLSSLSGVTIDLVSLDTLSDLEELEEEPLATFSPLTIAEEAAGQMDTPDITLDVNELVASLGTVSIINDTALPSATRPLDDEPGVLSPYVVRDIDELLLESRAAESLANHTTSTTTEHLPAVQADSDDAFPLLEIHELIGQLGRTSLTDRISAEATAPCDIADKQVCNIDPASLVRSLGVAVVPEPPPTQPKMPLLASSALVSGLGTVAPRVVPRSSCVEEIVRELGSTERVCDLALQIGAAASASQGELAAELGFIASLQSPAALHAEDLVSEFGSADRLANQVASAASPVYPELDPAELVAALGSVVAPCFPIVLHPDELVTELGSVGALVSLAAPAIAEDPGLDPAELVSSLGSVVPLKFPSIIHSNELIAELGDVSALVASATPVPSGAPAFNPAELVSALGAVIRPELPNVVHIEELIANLGSVGCIANVVPVSLIVAPVDPAQLVYELGSVVFPCVSRNVDIDGTIAMLGSANTLSALTPLPVDVSVISVDPAHLVGELGRVVVPALHVTSGPFAHGASNDAGEKDAGFQDKLDIPNIISSLGGVFSPELVICDAGRVRKLSTQTLVDEETADAAAAFTCAKLPHIQVSSDKQMRLKSDCVMQRSSLSHMDVDEIIHESRSRASSMSAGQQEGAQNISKLIAALRIPPIVVCRPLLGPPRSVLFSHLC